MLNSIFMNFFIMVAATTLTYHAYRSKGEYLSQHPLLAKIAFGLSNGFVGYMLMVSSIHINSNVIVDFRNFAVIASAIWGGPLSAILTASLIGGSRIILWGLSKGSIVAAVAIFAIGIGSSLISRKMGSFRQKWIGCCAWNIVVVIFALSYLLYMAPNYPVVVIYFTAGSMIIAYFLYNLIRFYVDFHESYTRMTKESTTDFLTGINNVRGFDIEFNKSINRSYRKNESLAFLLIDIDFFKKINDTYGHDSGNLVLKGLADILVDTCRSFDIISRNGGEEFSVILQDCSSGHAVNIAERIRKAIEAAEFRIDGENSVRITASIGISSYPDNSDNPEMLIKLADKALYSAKQSGRNKVMLHEDSEMHEGAAVK